MIVVLDSVRSAHNVGSIFRTSDAVGVDKIYLCGITPGPLDRFERPVTQLTKVSLGAEKTVAWEHRDDVSTLLTELRGQGFRIVAVEQDSKAIPLFELEPRAAELKKFALVMGAETTGVSKDALKLADTIVEIPQRGSKESLNVAVAFGVAAYWLTRTTLH